MLTISESAAEVIKVVLAGGDSGESSGLRIAAAANNGSAPEEFQASIASGPDNDDEVIETSGVRVFLDKQAATALDDKVLDAERDANGELGLAVHE